MSLIAVAHSLTKNDIQTDWDWIETNLMATLVSFDREEDITEFVKVKIESMRVQDHGEGVQGVVEGGDSSNFKQAVHKFSTLFNMPEDEKLVNCEFLVIMNISLGILYVIIFQIIPVVVGATGFHGKAGCT